MKIGKAAKMSEEHKKAKETATSRVYIGAGGLSKVGKKWVNQFNVDEKGARKESRTSFPADSADQTKHIKYPATKKSFVYPGTIEGRMDVKKHKR